MWIPKNKQCEPCRRIEIYLPESCIEWLSIQDNRSVSDNKKAKKILIDVWLKNQNVANTNKSLSQEEQ